MKTIHKYFLSFFSVALAIAIFVYIGAPESQDHVNPEVIISYEQAVPRDFTSPQISHVVDIRDAEPLIRPRLGVVKVADAIVLAGCPTKHPSCIAKALYAWTKNSIDHKDALLARDHLLSPEETILYREADDETISILLASLLRAEGLDARIGYTPYVTFVETSVLNETVWLDPSCSSCRMGDTRYNGPQQNIVWVG